MQPFNLGGEMIRSVALDRTSWNELPYKFEAGTPAIAEAYGFGQALDYVSAVGLDAIEAHEHELVVQAMDALAEIPGLRVFGPPADRRTGIVSFDARGHPPARRRADARLGRRRDPRRPPLHAAADDAPRRRRDDARELLPLHRAGEEYWADRRPAEPADRRTGIVSFELEGVHPHDVAQILDWEGVAVRAGHHCTQPLMTRLGVAATTRASFYLYSVPEDVDRLIAGLHKCKETFGV